MNWKAKIFAIGGGLGLVVGIAAAVLYVRTIQQTQGDRPNANLPAVQTGDLLRILVSLITLVRTIAGLADDQAG